jgi:signal transduction histidine kinase
LKGGRLKYLKHTLTATFIIAFAAVLYSIIFEKHSVSYYENQIKNVEHQIQERQKKLEKISTCLLDTLCVSPDSVLQDILFNVNIDCNSNEGFFCFSNDSLIYWSSNLPVKSEDLLKADTVEKFTNFDNELFTSETTTENRYVTKAYVRGKFKIIYAIGVITYYFYENDFLKSRFSDNFDVSSSLFLENAGCYNGFIVKGAGGSPLFVLGIDVNKNTNPVSMYARWFGIVLLLLSFVVFVSLFLFRKSIFKTVISIISIFACLMFFVYNDWGTFSAEFDFFNSSYYASSKFLASFGVLFLYVYFVVTIICVVFVKRQNIFLMLKKAGKYKPCIIRCSLIIFTVFQSVLCLLLPVTLTNDSNFSLAVHKIYDINVFTVLSYLLMALMFMGFAMLQILCLYNLKSKLHKTIIIFLQVLLSVLILILYNEHRIGIILVFVAYFIIASKICCNIKSKLKTFVLFVAFSTVFCVSIILHETFSKVKQITENLAESISQKNDPAFETMFAEISDKLLSDGQLRLYVKDTNINTDVILNYLGEKYFNGYFKSYDLNLNLCQKEDMLFVTESDNESDYNCFNFFDGEKAIYGNRTGELPLWFMSIGNGKVNYLVELSYEENFETRLFLIFTSLSESQYIGYPELLLDSKNQPNKLLQENDYSYAKYFKNKLVSHYGNFGYGYELNISKEIKSHSFFIERGYIHYYINIDQVDSLIISQPVMSALEYVSSNSFVFLFFIITLAIMLNCIGFDVLEISKTINFRQKIRILLLILVLFLLFVVGGTILWHTFSQFEKNKTELIEEKIQLIKNEFALRYGMSGNIQPARDLSSWLIELSNLYHIDINIYSLDGKLLSTSRPEIFDRKLLGLNMNIHAFVKLNTQNQPYYMHYDNIGNLKFNSIYFAFYNNKDEKLAYLNLPYFEQQRKFQEKWLALANTVINIFIVVIILGILFASIISNLLSKPLDTVRSQIGKFNLSGKSEHIKYKGNDEIGSLVNAYNLMLDKLAESAAKLAQTEREYAWREMARQIAHEIKNPLTPMMLNIQHVMRLKKNNDPNWEKQFENLAKSLIEQINILSATASEFSDFAKSANLERRDVDVVDLLEKQLTAFKGYEKIKISLCIEGVRPKTVSALYQQLQRVFTNLIKNAVQAIGDDNEGEIELFASDLSDSYYRFKVQDSGTGISEELHKHLFQPNFTTKSSGTGLGLAISKNIIENIGGRIYYSLSENGKTCFIIELPIKKPLKE